MTSSDTSGKNFAKLKFIGFFSGSVLLCVIILSSFWTPNPSTSPQESKELTTQDSQETAQLLEISQVLHLKWTQLEQLYDEHALSLVDPTKNNNGQATKQIMESEVDYAKVLDSVSSNNSASPSAKKIDSVVNSFRVILQNKQALNTNISELLLNNNSKPANANVPDNKIQEQKLNELKNDLVAKNDLITKLKDEVNSTSTIKNNLTANEQKLIQLQNELKSKNDLITKLETNVNSASALKKNLTANDQKIIQLQNDLKTKTDMIASLQSQITMASAKSGNLNSTEQKLHQVQNDLLAKNDLIAKLQSQLKAAPAKPNTTASVDDQKLRDLQKDLQSKNALIAKLQSQVKSLPLKSSDDGPSSTGDVKKMKDELEFLKWALRSEVSTNHTLTNDINQLKQANATLKK